MQAFWACSLFTRGGMAVNVIEVEKLTKVYDNKTAVDGADFAVRRGEIFGFLGPNGAGKTTTINMLTGLARISSGQVRIMGQDYSSGVKKAQHLMGVVPDESNLYEEMDGFENLTFCAALYGMERKMREKRARELLEMFGLAQAGQKPFKAYSKGMKRKLTIAAGIIHQPEILFLDEPTTGIDVASARQIRKLVGDLNQGGTSIFLTTHYMEEAERLCHRLAFIVEGRIIRLGRTEKLMQEAQKENIVQFAFQGDGKKLQQLEERLPGVNRVEQMNESTARIYSSEAVDLVSLVDIFRENGFSLFEARVIRPSLEEVFVNITGIEHGRHGSGWAGAVAEEEVEIQ